MNIPWIYLALTAIMLWFGLDILIHKRGGVYVWQRPYGYRIEYYTGKLAQIVGAILTIFGLIFTLDAIRFLLSGNQIAWLQYGFCCGSVILIGAIAGFMRKYDE
jgi:hypothetical protein